MVSPELVEIARQSEEFYENKLRSQLEPTHRGQFVAIVPDAGRYFVAKSFHEAAEASRKACPNQQGYVIRIGFKAAVEFGCAQ